MRWNFFQPQASFMPCVTAMHAHTHARTHQGVKTEAIS